MDKSDENLTTKQKIINITMDIIAAEGFQNITIRKIASRANVNVAAVNYHFGSKDGVINAALTEVTDEMRKNFALLKEQTDGDVEDRLFTFIYNYTEIINKYPDIIRNMINHAIHNKPLDQHIEYMTFLKTEGIELLKETIARVRPEMDKDVLCLRTLHLLSTLSFPVLLGGYIREITGVDLKDLEARKKHARLLLESIVGADKAAQD